MGMPTEEGISEENWGSCVFEMGLLMSRCA